MKYYIIFLLSIFTLSSLAQNEASYLTKTQISNDLTFLDEMLQNTSSYQGLNGYTYKKDFDAFLENVAEQSVTKYDFELFLSKTLGKIGDRHSYIKGDRSRDSLFFPFAFAPHNDKVVVLDYNREKKEFSLWNTDFPYLKSINDIQIKKLLAQVLPGDVLAPKKSYTLRAVRELRDIDKICKLLNIELQNPMSVTLTDDNDIDKVVNMDLFAKNKRGRIWDERFHKNNFFLQDEQSNDPEIIKPFFTLKENIGYVQIVKMLNKEDSPTFFEYLNNFMLKAKETDAIIIDVRDNGGGSRDLIQELAGYFIHPDSLYVVNVARQRGEFPLNEDLKGQLHYRYLYSRDEYDTREKQAIDQFMTAFKPMYTLDNKKFSEYHYYMLNGQKVSKGKYHYDKPIYILANERSFSAASVLVSVFKGIPNIKIVGVNTDGSSGNSERFELPNSGLKGKISTMVSFQKNGEILDGIGTAPDIVIERNLEQIFFKEDYQLNTLIELIKVK